MVRIMSNKKKTKWAVSPWGDNDKDGGGHCFAPGKAAFQDAPLCDEDCSASAPSICAFWSAIAIGALLSGQPNESVSRARVYLFACVLIDNFVFPYACGGASIV